MLIISIIIIVSLFHISGQGVLSNTYFKEHLSVFASKYIKCDTENNTLESKLYSIFKHSPNGKGIFITPMETQLQWKRHYGPNRKTSFYERLFLEVVIVMVKDKKTVEKIYLNKNQFYTINEEDKSNVSSSFREIWTSFFFFFWVIVFFSLSWSIGRRSNLAKRGVSCSSLLLHASQLIYVMNLLTLTTLTLHFTNPSVNAALKFYVTSLN